MVDLLVGSKYIKGVLLAYKSCGLARDPGANIPLNILMIGEVGPWALAVAEVWHYK